MKLKIPKVIQKEAPLWTEKIRKRDTMYELRQPCRIKEKLLDISLFPCCVVGELNDFIWDNEQGYGGCSECCAFSQRVYCGMSTNREQLERSLVGLAKHWKEKHLGV